MTRRYPEIVTDAASRSGLVNEAQRGCYMPPWTGAEQFFLLVRRLARRARAGVVLFAPSVGIASAERAFGALSTTS